MDLRGKKILLIDDDSNIHEIVEGVFSTHSVNVISAFSGKIGLKQLFDQKPDLVILDLMMPEMDGWETCRQIRMVSDVPVLMLTSLADEKNVIRGLDNGADDFVGKPFNLDLLLSRVRALLRRAQNAPQPDRTVHYQDEYIQFDFDRRKLYVSGNAISLTNTEYRLLAALIQVEGRVMSYEQLLENVWGWEYQDSPEYVHVYISHLRKKIEGALDKVTYFQSIYGVGYQFEQQVG
jgi:DNA-binding response OmpR family regulator